jgi:hypothetical protein
VRVLALPADLADPDAVDRAIDAAMRAFGRVDIRVTNTGGTVSFGRALALGAGIGVVASLCYVATWQVIRRRVVPVSLLPPADARTRTRPTPPPTRCRTRGVCRRPSPSARLARSLPPDADAAVGMRGGAPRHRTTAPAMRPWGARAGRPFGDISWAVHQGVGATRALGGGPR